MYPEDAQSTNAIPYISRTVIPGKTRASGVQDSFGVIPRVGVTGSFNSEPYDVIVVSFLTPIHKLC